MENFAPDQSFFRGKHHFSSLGWLVGLSGRVLFPITRARANLFIVLLRFFSCSDFNFTYQYFKLRFYHQNNFNKLYKFCISRKNVIYLRT